MKSKNTLIQDNEEEPTLTPFEEMELRRKVGKQRLIGILAAVALEERIKELKTSGLKMSHSEKTQWEVALKEIIAAQIKVCGYDA